MSVSILGCALRALAAAIIAAAAAPAHAQNPDPVSELIRKAEAREMDNGFCASIADWPAGTADSYLHFLRSAEVGFAKINRFRNNAHCQFDRVIEVYNGPTGKCVRYVWFACATSNTCAKGEDTDCQQANGGWKRQPR